MRCKTTKLSNRFLIADKNLFFPFFTKIYFCVPHHKYPVNSTQHSNPPLLIQPCSYAPATKQNMLHAIVVSIKFVYHFYTKQILQGLSQLTVHFVATYSARSMIILKIRSFCRATYH
ncbi:hypothetical protein VCUG_01599 [Vavraia culicis subsp. floridensis]|uniref:Uncharacterized protein n=1 Tax=Vavraia culicis (isolate floridensis) TaxID=948595 RepID=L2GTC7_VAVCU|nr:uncharacterized protein VCUG_01599 [Vavraia culicis subsp. floridensis]ELA46901.1 hypothetical protein VCUG_01599 [Vavraia culicis subsp. floridensis]